MAREKNKRNISFKPIVKSYLPENIVPNGTTTLLDEEIEAIYLMDLLDLYQEEAAKRMNISRPTFTRIIKNARKKLAHGLISGYKIIIEDNKKDFIIAICGENDDLQNIETRSKYIYFYKMSGNSIILLNRIDNPVSKSSEKPAIILPKVFLENNVNIFISSKIGLGLNNTLLSHGIRPVIKDKVDLKNLNL
ncbi:MAG: DUF134 domain-containing protein [Campylobacterota bacterium]|nr:DUF134 domain-containing protein [Campylobacterota bacterium]